MSDFIRIRPCTGRDGHAVGRSRGPIARRGSILILVVGVLVLLAISATLYMNVGQQERLSSSAEATTSAQEEIINKIVEFLGQTLADDLFAAPIDPSNDSQKLSPVRPFEDGVEYPRGQKYPSLFRTGERWDSPFTQPTRQSGLPFNVLADPWLASTEPDDLKSNGGGGGGGTVDGIPDTWKHLSNVNPQGTFVDLGKLVDRNVVQQFSIYGNVTIGGNNPSDPFDLDTLIANGVPNTRGDGNDTFDYSKQMDDVFDEGIDGVPTYHDQQYGTDTDGDGRMDARWTELPEVYGFPLGMRVFTAVRIVDLSSMVNVNTSIETGQTGPDDEGDTVGFPRTPSDIDLYTMLLNEYGRLGGTVERFFSGVGSSGDLGAYSEHLRSMGVLGYAFDYLEDAGVLRYGTSYNGSSSTPRLRAVDRATMYGDFLGGAQNSFDDFRPYGAEDELELRTYWGMSNDLVTSRLEEHFDVLNGKGIPGHTPWLSPFMNRVPYEVDYTNNSPTTEENIAITGIRNKVTTINGSRSVSAWNVSARDTSIQLKDNINDLLTPIGSNADVDLQPVFSGIAWALLPYAVKHDKDFSGKYLNTNIYGKPAKWTTAQPTDIRSYGGGSTADFAYLRSAMVAVNLLDYFDPDTDADGLPIDDDPTVRVLRFEQETIQDANNPNGRDPDTELAGIFPWGEIHDDGVNASQKNVMLVGLEKQPFFREVAHVQVWNGHQDLIDPNKWIVDQLTGAPPGDLYFELVAFELGNPWDGDIDLSQYEIALGNKTNTDLQNIFAGAILPAGGNITVSLWYAVDLPVGSSMATDWSAQVSGRLGNGAKDVVADLVQGTGFLLPESLDDDVTLWRKDVTLSNNAGTTIARVLVDRITANQTGSGDEDTFPGKLATVGEYTDASGGNAPGLQFIFNSSLRRNVARVMDDSGATNGFPPYVLQSPEAIGQNGFAALITRVEGLNDPIAPTVPPSSIFSITSGSLIDQFHTLDTNDKGYPAGFADTFYAPFQMHILNNEDIASPFDLLEVSSITHVYVPVDGLSFDPVKEPAFQDKLHRDRYVTVSEMLGDENLSMTLQARGLNPALVTQVLHAAGPALGAGSAWPADARVMPDGVANHFVGKLDYTRDIPNGSSVRDVPQALPLAARVVDAFDTLTPMNGDGLVEGRININTASLGVLQSLPFLHPRFDAGDIKKNSRYAKAVRSYRDRSAIRNPVGMSWRNRATTAALTDANGQDRLREDITGAARSPASAGFTSLGELALISKWDSVGKTGSSGVVSHRPPSKDNFMMSRQVLTAAGHSGKNFTYKPLNPDAAATLNNLPNDPADDVTEWLIIPRAISNVISLRSDVYVAYIKVIGFTPADVDEAIQKEDDETDALDVLEPTFAQRYIAVFDRSNVKNPGDRPRLLFAVQAVPTR